MMKLANRGGASQDGGFHGGGEICATRNDSAYLPEDSMQRPVTQYRTCSVKNLVHLEISDKFSVFYRIIDFYAFLHTVAKRDLIRRPIV